jgi:hypothetical protein
MTGPPDEEPTHPTYPGAPYESYWQEHPQHPQQPQWQQPPPPPPPGHGYQPYSYGGYGLRGTPPPSNVGWAIAAVLLFWPLAIPAFIYSSRVDSAWYRGDVSGAQRASANARTCGIWALVVGVAFFILFFVLSVAVFSDTSVRLTG